MILQINAGSKLLYVGYVATEKRAKELIDHYSRHYGKDNLVIKKSVDERKSNDTT